MIRALLADDEEHALNLLELLLRHTGEVEVVCRCGNGIDALEKIGVHKPDVAFLDIEMPGINGMELAERLSAGYSDTQVVFVTAYDRYAISAFENDAVDYLLKPLDMDRLKRSVQRVKREVSLRWAAEALKQASTASHAGTEMAAAYAAPGKTDTAFSVQLLGEIQILNGNHERLKWRTAKEKELFAYLAVQQGNRIHRDVLLDELWPDEHYQKAKVYLHTCVSYLRRDLRQLGAQDSVLYEDEKYALSPSLAQSDYRALRNAAQALRGSDVPTKAALEDAIGLYRGPLLMDEDYHWAEEDIRHLENMVESLQLSLIQQYEKEGEFGKMIQTARLLLQHSPYNEEAYRLLMKGNAGSGKHDEVFRIYEEMIGRLDELQIQPSAITRALYDDLKVKKRRGSEKR